MCSSMRPEEQVRQALIEVMVNDLGYPPALLTVEVALNTLPHLQCTENLPRRRADLLCFTKKKGKEGLHPLLLVECKAVPLNEKTVQQVVGYNYYVKAPYVCIVNQNECKTGWEQQNGEYCFVDGIPRYEDIAVD